MTDSVTKDELMKDRHQLRNEFQTLADKIFIAVEDVKKTVHGIDKNVAVLSSAFADHSKKEEDDRMEMLKALSDKADKESVERLEEEQTWQRRTIIIGGIAFIVGMLIQTFYITLLAK